jgi:hypothetical protein
MAAYFAKYSITGRNDYQHHIPSEWLTSVLICGDCGREYARTVTSARLRLPPMLFWSTAEGAVSALGVTVAYGPCSPSAR